MTSPRELFERAFELASFLHTDPEVAARVALEAFGRLKVTARSQARRRRYKPLGRLRQGEPPNSPTRYRVSLERASLLQLLVLIASEPHERRQEQGPAAGQPDESAMVVRFVAYLVRICLRRNALHTGVGIGRLLHSYSTEEVMALYDLVLQDPERFCTADYLRGRKRLLLDEVRDRFDGWVELVRGARGEIRLQAQSHSARIEALAYEALERCTPWDSECSLPNHLDPTGEELAAFRFAGDHPDEEHPVEARRIHALLHPQCLRRLVLSLGFAEPKRKLSVPRFSRSSKPRGSDPDRRSEPPRLGSEQWAAADAELQREELRRKKAPAKALSVRVDGVEACRWDLVKSRRLSLSLDPEAERVEIWTARGQGGEEVLLALFLLGSGGKRTVRLEGGQEIAFRFDHVEPTSDERLTVKVSYRETHLHRAAALFIRQVTAWVGERPPWRAAPRATWGSLAVLLALTIGVTLLPREGPRGSAPGRVRGTELPVGVELGEVEKVFVGHLGTTTFHECLRSRLLAGLQSGPWLVVPSTSEADAVLKGEGAAEGNALCSEEIATTLQLVNRRGEVLWRRQLAGTPDQVALEARTELAAALATR